MKVLLAESAGFCYGVKRAVERAEKTAEETRGCWMLGISFTTPMWLTIWRPGASGRRSIPKHWDRGIRW